MRNICTYIAQIKVRKDDYADETKDLVRKRETGEEGKGGGRGHGKSGNLRLSRFLTPK